MSDDEQTAYARGKHAAFRDARPRKLGTLSRCEFRRPELVKAWHAGYADQVTASTKPRTPEQEANCASMSKAIEGWLEKTK